MKSSRMRAKTNNAKTATKLLVAMTGAPHAEGQALRAQWLCRPWQVGRGECRLMVIGGNRPRIFRCRLRHCQVRPRAVCALRRYNSHVLAHDSSTSPMSVMYQPPRRNTTMSAVALISNSPTRTTFAQRVY
jgi:hypothetical protein